MRHFVWLLLFCFLLVSACSSRKASRTDAEVVNASPSRTESASQAAPPSPANAPQSSAYEREQGAPAIGRQRAQQKQKMVRSNPPAQLAEPVPVMRDELYTVEEEAEDNFGADEYGDDGFGDTEEGQDWDPDPAPRRTPEFPSREAYAHIEENDYLSPLSEPQSTFSIDVDRASYANVRRFLTSGQLPPPGAVRIEELVNYFDYDYPQPLAAQPFSINTELSSCPWNAEHLLLHIGLQGREIDRSELPASNLVFLLDVSGSMNAPNKLPLLKQAFSMLVEQLDPDDRVAIVVYAGAAGVVLPSTPVRKQADILAAIERLNAGGSTAGGAGIELAYKIAQENFLKNGNNRVILATDGDFNVGPSSESQLVRMIEEKREDGVFLSVLGFGTGNYQDSRMEQLADKGNGNYAYLDTRREAEKVLVREMGGTLFTIAKDVKLQLEFNPKFVKGYRLIGYENRRLAAQDFDDDTKDAGELGAGHTVTALYEIVPHAAATDVREPEEGLRYQDRRAAPASASDELVYLKLRYKQPDADESQLLSETVARGETTLSATSENFRWSAAVAGYGMLLRHSEYSGEATWASVRQLAQGAVGDDARGYRQEFLSLLGQAQRLDEAWHELVSKREERE